jgi:hypothetical protein
MAKSEVVPQVPDRVPRAPELRVTLSAEAAQELSDPVPAAALRLVVAEPAALRVAVERAAVERVAVERAAE